MLINLKFGSNFLISMIVFFVLTYGAIVFMTIDKPALFKNPIVATIVKGPILKVVNSELVFSIQGDVERISFHFDKPKVDAAKISFGNQPIEQRSAYRLDNSDDNHWLYIINNNDKQETLNNVTVSIIISDDGINKRQPSYIDEIKINGDIVSPMELNKYIKVDKAKKSIFMHYPFALENISNTLANYVGGYFVKTILFILLLITAVQFFMLVLAVRFYIFRQNPKVNNKHLIDKFTGQYSIPLGLLGTIISIWYSLEVTNQNISNYGDLIEIIKIAIFTSVLGITSFLLYEARNRIDAHFSNSP